MYSLGIQPESITRGPRGLCIKYGQTLELIKELRVLNADFYNRVHEILIRIYGYM